MTTSPEPAPSSTRESRRIRSIAAFSVGAVLLLAAFWAVFKSREALSAAWAAARTAPAWMVAISILLPGVNWLLSASMFYTITRRYGPVGRREMAALMGSAWLLNMLPARPGLAGRIAYHRIVNGIPLADSGKILVQATSCTGIALGLLVLKVLWAIRYPGAWPGIVGGMYSLWTLALLASMIWFGRYQNTIVVRALWASAIRYSDALVWAVRYYFLFRILGQPISPEGAAAIAAVSMAAGFLPVPIGLREWVVGLTAAALPPEFFPSAAPVVDVSGGLVAAAAPGVAKDLGMRACELLWAIPLGLVCTACLGRRWARANAAAGSVSAEPPLPKAL